MTTKPLAAVFFLFSASAPLRAQTIWQTEQVVAEVVRQVAPLRLKLERDQRKLGENTGMVSFLDGRLVRSRRYYAARVKQGAAWRYSVNYNRAELVHDGAYLALAEAKGLIHPGRETGVSEIAIRLMPEVEAVAARLAFLDSAKAQVRERFRERFEDRKMQVDYPDESNLEEMKLAAGLDRLFYEWDKAVLDCRRLTRLADTARLLNCPGGGGSIAAR